jgi:pyrroloquinoline quinone (PQQ) biosynthesis protein C
MKYRLDLLRPILDSHRIRSHEFLVRFRDGQWSRQQGKTWVEQQFYFSISLPSAFAALYARIPDRFWHEKRAIVELLDVEAWGNPGLRCHSHHFRELAEFFGTDVAALSIRQPKQYTADYLKLRLDLCLNTDRPIAEGLAALALGNEILNLHLYSCYREGIHKIAGCEQCPTGYFDAHLSDEEEDAKVFARLFDAVVVTEQEYSAAQKALLEILDARLNYMDSLVADLNSITDCVA